MRGVSAVPWYWPLLRTDHPPIRSAKSQETHGRFRAGLDLPSTKRIKRRPGFAEVDPDED
jgi:hypothetical protein